MLSSRTLVNAHDCTDYSTHQDVVLSSLFGVASPETAITFPQKKIARLTALCAQPGSHRMTKIIGSVVGKIPRKRLNRIVVDLPTIPPSYAPFATEAVHGYHCLAVSGKSFVLFIGGPPVSERKKVYTTRWDKVRLGSRSRKRRYSWRHF